MNFSDPRHPIWSFARSALVLAAFLGFLAAFCNRFDEDEWRNWFGIAIALLSAQGGHHWLKARKARQDPHDEGQEPDATV